MVEREGEGGELGKRGEREAEGYEGIVSRELRVREDKGEVEEKEAEGDEGIVSREKSVGG